VCRRFGVRWRLGRYRPVNHRSWHPSHRGHGASPFTFTFASTLAIASASASAYAESVITWGDALV
jgi:hypothetical protein